MVQQQSELRFVTQQYIAATCARAIWTSLLQLRYEYIYTIVVDSHIANILDSFATRHLTALTRCCMILRHTQPMSVSGMYGPMV